MDFKIALLFYLSESQLSNNVIGVFYIMLDYSNVATEKYVERSFKNEEEGRCFIACVMV